MPALEATVLSVVEDVLGLLELDEFYVGLLEALRRAIPSDWASLNDVGPGPLDVSVIAIPDVPPEVGELFAALKDQNPLIQHYNRTLTGRAYRFSDVISREELHSLRIYREVYRPLGVEHQIAFTLPATENRLLGVALSRRSHDYTDHERQILDRCRPALIQAFRNAVLYRRLNPGGEVALPRTVSLLREVGLSSRQSEVLALTVQGVPAREIGERLGISRRTVSKHLELAYRALRVNSRAGAADRMMRLLGPKLHG